MEGKLSLQKIIESVLDDYGVEYASTGDSTVRTLRRAFDRLMVNLGSDKKLLKNDGRTMEFDEVEARIIKIIISQLYDENSIAAKFTNSHAKNSKAIPHRKGSKIQRSMI